MTKKVQQYIATEDQRAFAVIISAQIEIGEAPPGDGSIPFVKMQTVDGEQISVLPISTRLLSALRRWNNKNTPKFDFTVYDSGDKGLLRRSDEHNWVTTKPTIKKKMQKSLPRSALAPRPHSKRLR